LYIISSHYFFTTSCYFNGKIGSWVWDGMRGRGKAIGGPRGSRGRGVVKRGKKEEFSCKVTKCTQRIECKGEEEDLGRIEMRDDGLIAEFLTGCFVVRLVYEVG
jgi:hypothetical protein